jgi:hypothetical protein
MKVVCECGGQLRIREWGRYTDETPLDSQGNLILTQLSSVLEERRGWEVECRVCGLEMTSSFVWEDGKIKPKV